MSDERRKLRRARSRSEEAKSRLSHGRGLRGGGGVGVAGREEDEFEIAFGESSTVNASSFEKTIECFYILEPSNTRDS